MHQPCATSRSAPSSYPTHPSLLPIVGAPLSHLAAIFPIFLFVSIASGSIIDTIVSKPNCPLAPLHRKPPTISIYLSFVCKVSFCAAQEIDITGFWAKQLFLLPLFGGSRPGTTCSGAFHVAHRRRARWGALVVYVPIINNSSTSYSCHVFPGQKV